MLVFVVGLAFSFALGLRARLGSGDGCSEGLPLLSWLLKGATMGKVENVSAFDSYLALF